MALPVIVVGAGASGLIAALAAAEHGARVVVLERGTGELKHLASNTERSTGLIPAANTTLQRAAGILDDTPDLLAADILHENGDSAAPLVRRCAAAASQVVEWLAGLLPSGALVCKTDFLYPGHSRLRMHGPPDGYGLRLREDLLGVVMQNSQIELRSGLRVHGLVSSADGVSIRGVHLGGGRVMEANAVVLATNGFGANQNMVRAHLGDGVAAALYLGSPLNTGDGIQWAVSMGAATERMTSYQGHASVAFPEGPLVTWGVIVNGGILVDPEGHRFGNELVGYSAYSENVMQLPGAGAIEIFHPRCFAACLNTRFEEVIRAGKVETYPTLAELCSAHNLNLHHVSSELTSICGLSERKDRFGREWSVEAAWGPEDLHGPLHAIRVRASLFHTQGGLKTDESQRVLLAARGEAIPGLFASGGAAAGLSGENAKGYLSGNGLLHAVVSGFWAGEAAAKLTIAEGLDHSISTASRL